MPIRRSTITRRHTRGNSDLTPERVEVLFTGCAFFAEDALFESDEHAKKAWSNNRAQLLVWWHEGLPADFPCTPGLFSYRTPRLLCRPFGWWRFDAPERRRITSVIDLTGAGGGGVITERKPTAAEIARIWRSAETICAEWGRPAEFLGMPSAVSGVGAFGVESESDFLVRLGLATPVELAALHCGK